MKALLAASALLFLAVTAQAQTVSQLYDRLSDAQSRGDDTQVVELSKTFYARKKNLVSWDYLRGAQSAARLGQTDLAFSWLDKMRELGWRDAGMLEKDEAFRSLHTDGRWLPFLQRVRESARLAIEALDPGRAGMAENPSVAKVEGWLADPKLDAKTLYERLTKWSEFPTPRSTGVWLRFENRISETITAPYYVYIPSRYTAARPTGLLVYLRGGIGSADFPSEIDADYLVENPLQSYCEENNLIELFPEGNSAVFWSRQVGMQNIAGQLKQVRQRFFIDDDRVFLAGFSNGGTGVYAFALNSPSEFAGLYSINGALGGAIFLSNLGNRPLFTLASENDDYSDVARIKKLHSLAQQRGLPWTITELPGQGHYYRPYEDDAFPAFFASLKTGRRGPLPQSVTWETADISAGRCDWLQIDALDLEAPRAAWHSQPAAPLYTVERNGRMEARSLADESGIVRATLKNNRFELLSSRVAKVTLYLSPEQIDFTKPVEVVVNGKLLFKKRVSMDRAVVAESFREAFDRQRIYGAKLTLSLGVQKTRVLPWAK